MLDDLFAREMTHEKSEKKFVRTLLPWAVAVGGLLLYLLTLNHWVNFTNLGIIAKVTGWDWRHSFSAPVFHLLTLPFRALPVSSQPIALNLFSAICAALTLALLARSVALLPHDRTRDQRQREHSEHFLLSLPHAWLPPLLAVVVCALQLTFWEHATSMTGEMLDLLMFAYVIRCLLEYRISQNESWLSKMAFVYGLAVTNNWAMINYFPLFLIALIWIKRWDFFKFGFIARMLGFGSTGLLLYFFLPALDVTSANPTGTFFDMLKANLGSQKGMTWNNLFIRAGELRTDFFTAAMTAVLPILLMGIRWPSFQGDISPAAYNMAIFMFRFLHVAFLVFTVWIFFDPPFSGREVGKSFVHFLSFYYLAAIVTGYLAGYVMLVFGKPPTRQSQRSRKSSAAFGKVLVGLVWATAVLVPVGLLWKNFSTIRASNGPEFFRFADAMAKALPEKGATVLSDDPHHLFLLQAALQRSGKKSENLLLETSALPYPIYHRELAARYPSYGNELLKAESLPDHIDNVTLLKFLIELNKKHRIFYLHPSYGYYFEQFYSRPHGLVWELKPYEKDQIAPPQLTSSQIAENQEFWTDFRKNSLNKITPYIKKTSNFAVLAAIYSRALNAWGVQLQKAKKLGDAKEYFADSLVLNPENVAAFVNLDSNQQLREPTWKSSIAQEVEKKLAQYRSWDAAVSQNGPFDQVQACLRIGQILSIGNNIRQGALNFLRVLELEPNHKDARMGLVASYLQMGYPEKALESINILREQKDKMNEEMDFTIQGLEAQAYADKGDVQVAEELLIVLFGKRPDDEQISGMLIQFYIHTKRHQEALDVVDQILKKSPDNPGALLYSGALNIYLKQYSKAVEAMDHFLSLFPGTSAALMNRAIANLQAKKYDEAKRDYETLERLNPPNPHTIHYGLGEIAYQTNQKEEAIQQYRKYLETAPPGDEYNQVTERLKELQGGDKKQ